MPKSLLKHFTDESGKLWYATRPSTKDSFGPVVQRTPEGSFWRRNFFTTLDEANRPSDSVERNFYGAVDNHIGKLIPEVKEILASGRFPIFSNSALDAFRHLIIALYKRSIDTVADFDEKDVGSEVIESISRDATSQLGISRSELISQLNLPNPVAIGRDVRVGAQILYPGDLIDALEGSNVSVIEAEGRSSFIIGSRMVYRIANGTTDKIGSVNVEIWLPITPKFSLVLHKIPRYPRAVIVWPKSKVREVNDYICRSCLEVASHSELLIRSLLNQRG